MNKNKPRNKKRIYVNPARNKGGDYLVVEDRLGRRIEYRKEGTEVTKDTHISRSLKAGDLVVVEKKQPKKKATKKVNMEVKDNGSTE